MTKPTTRSTRRKNSRKGAIAVLAAVFMVILLAMVAFVVDLGYVLVAQTELQRAADAAAHAAAMEYRLGENATAAIIAARNTASDYASGNAVTHSGATVDKNWYNADLGGDVVVGNYDFSSRTMTHGDASTYNAVRVRIRRDTTMNGEIPLFFARVMGHNGIPIEAEATAAIIRDVGGLRAVEGERAPFLPITIEQDYWEEQLEAFTDERSWDPDTETASNGGDGSPEVILFPHNTTSGNFGTVNVGISANSTSHLADVIENGLTQEHMGFHGGDLSFDENGEIALTGDTGLSASTKDDLTGIIGKPVIIPLYSTVSGPGNNATYTIVKFVGVRVVTVQLTGNDKHVAIQPAEVTFKGVIPSTTPSGWSSTTSYQIYSPVAIVN